VSDAQYKGDNDLARGLADANTRGQAVASVVALGSAKVPILLSWTRKPPARVDVYELNIGLADAFGEMKTRDAIPFLVNNIGIDRTHAPNTWLKSPDAVEARLAAAAALIKIGSEAASAVYRAASSPMYYKDKLAAMFVISRMKDAPGARSFLLSALGEANLERGWAEEDLKQFAEQK